MTKAVCSQTLHEDLSPERAITLIGNCLSVHEGGGGQSQPPSHAPVPAGEARHVTLPLLATGADVRELVKCLSKRPAGLTVVQAMNSDQRRLFDERKIAAYKFWGVLEQDEGRLRLTSFGREFALQLCQETEAYRGLLRRVESYREALTWIYREGLEVVSFDLVASLWQRQYPASEELRDNETVKGNVVCFFHLCQSADLGIVTIGKRTRPARIRVDRDELERWVNFFGHSKESLFAVPTVDEPTTLPAHPSQGIRVLNAPESDTVLRVFVSHCERAKLAEQIQEFLWLVDIECVIVPRDGSTGHVLSKPRLSALRRCQSAIIVADDDDLHGDGAGRLLLDEQLRTELGAAYALFDRQIMLLWRSNAPIPDDLREVHHSCGPSDEVTWADGLQLLKLIKALRSSMNEVETDHQRVDSE